MSKKGLARQYLVRVDHAERSTLERVADRLGQLGMELDSDVGWLPLDPASHSFVARGLLRGNDPHYVEEQAHVELFPDFEVRTSES